MSFNRPIDPQVWEDLYGVDYGGWSPLNWFSAKGRAENLEARADRLESKGKTERAEKLQVKAAEKEAKASGLKDIAPKFKNAASLWADQYPFGRREKTKAIWRGNKKIEHIAQGYKPTSKFYNAEMRATIIGGLYILGSAWNPQTNSNGYAPFSTLNLSSVEFKARKDKDDKKLIKLVGQAASALGDRKPNTLKNAAKYVREQAAERGLASAAWSQRALLLVGGAFERSSRATQIGAVSLGVLASAGGIVATVLTMGAASPAAVAAGTATASAVAALNAGTAVSIGASVASTGAAAAGKASGVKLEAKWNRYQLEIQNALATRANKIQTAQLDRTTEVTESLDDELYNARVQRYRKMGEIIGPSVWAGAAIIGAAIFIRVNN
jgi:hypothetical protein